MSKSQTDSHRESNPPSAELTHHKSISIDFKNAHMIDVKMLGARFKKLKSPSYDNN